MIFSALLKALLALTGSYLRLAEISVTQLGAQCADWFLFSWWLHTTSETNAMTVTIIFFKVASSTVAIR